MAKIRLNRFLSQSGISSRRAAEKLMEAGRVKVNGAVTKEMGFMVDPESDSVLVDGKKVKTDSTLIYYLLNKPKGYITTSTDPFCRKKVTDLVPKNPRVYPVGRLDYDTSGLLILTNDGELTYKLTHPKFEKEKEYVVFAEAKKKPQTSNNKLQIFESLRDDFLRGIRLGEGLAKADKVIFLEQKGNKVAFRMIIHQGWNRQIRRMCEKVGLDVLNLKRIRIGSLKLGGIKEGEWRKLSEKEVKKLF